MFVSKINLKKITTETIAVEKLTLLTLMMQTRAYLTAVMAHLCAVVSAQELVARRGESDSNARRFDIGNSALQGAAAAISMSDIARLQVRPAVLCVPAGPGREDTKSKLLRAACNDVSRKSLDGNISQKAADCYRTQSAFHELVSLRRTLNLVFFSVSLKKENAWIDFVASPVSGYSYSPVDTVPSN